MAPPDLDKLCPKSFSAFYDSQKEELTLAVGTDGKHGTDLSVKNLNRHDYGLDVYGNLSNALPSGGATAMSLFLPIHPGHLVGNLRFALDRHGKGGTSVYCALNPALLQLFA